MTLPVGTGNGAQVPWAKATAGAIRQAAAIIPAIDLENVNAIAPRWTGPQDAGGK